MRPTRAAILAVALGLLVPSAALACLWDYDTIKMERTRFPNTLELITGKFLRHSPEFYQWRIADRLKRLETDPSNLALLDDLAVAYDKTDQHEKAIETANRADKLRPGRYETAANLGTFYFHAGQLEAGLPHIDRALKINPDAHFGREKYQKLLVEYVLERRDGGPLKLPLASVTLAAGADPTKIEAHSHSVANTFPDFLKARGPKSDDRHLSDAEVRAAVKGITGMMKFGKHDSPVLLEALGFLLVHPALGTNTDAKQLAARAFLKASYEVRDEAIRLHYQRFAYGALRHQFATGDDEPVSLERVESEFQKELEEGRAWYAELRERELGWIRDGKNPEAEFDKLYVAEPSVTGMDVTDPMNPMDRLLLLVAGAVVALTAFGVGGWLLVRYVRRRGRSA